MRRWLLAACLSLAFGEALACGHCVEDKMAAVYDHAVVEQALARKQHIAFLALEGPIALADLRGVAEAAGGVRGVDKRSVRVARDGSALSLAFDPRRMAPDRLQRLIGARLADRGLSVTVLKVIDERTAAPTPDQGRDTR